LRSARIGLRRRRQDAGRDTELIDNYPESASQPAVIASTPPARASPFAPPLSMTAMRFAGYRRTDGSVGVRNHVLVLSVTGLTGPTARRIGRAVPGVRIVATPWGGGLMGEDAALQRRALVALGAHPNVAATLVVGASPPQVTAVASAIGATGRDVEALILDDCGHDAIALTERGTRIAARMLHQASRLQREPVDARELFLALECGRSDPSSGLVANPLVGRVVDALVAHGGRAVLGETIEWLGAEHLLAQRAADADVARAIEAAVQRREAMAIRAGMNLTGNNPDATNIAAGLSTIEEKSLGAIAKGGGSAIRSVVDIAQAPAGPGLHVMDAPAYAPESVTGLVAAGAQVVLFTTGVGNSFVSGIAPTIKICANPAAAPKLREQLDFDATAVFDGRETLEAAAARLLALTLEVAGGALTWGEVLDEGEEVVSRLGPAL
jgi:altronate dehydratase large subunit